MNSSIEQAQPISKSELKTRIREEQNKTKAAIDRLGKEAEQRLEAELQEELAAFEGTKQATAKTKTKAAQKKFGKEGVKAARSEVKQMYNCTCFRAIAVVELTRRKKERAQEGLMFVTQK